MALKDENQSGPQELDHFQAEKKTLSKGIEVPYGAAAEGAGNRPDMALEIRRMNGLRSELGAFPDETDVKAQGKKQR